MSNEVRFMNPPRVWRVGALCRAIADSLDSRFNPLTVSGEIGGFSRAASGHCYFTLKDDSGQLRGAMFRRAVGALGFAPKDGDRVEVTGRLSVYEARGELQMVVETMRLAGQGNLMEEFLKLKIKLEQEGLFASDRKRPIPALPRMIGVVTSLGAAALQDVLSALRRRAPHIPVVISPASVQGGAAPGELANALQALYDLVAGPDVILLVRGGGSPEDLWAFNDEQLARTIALSPVPLISGVGHETDFSIADFVADLRAPTPTAAAELASNTSQLLLERVAEFDVRLDNALMAVIDRQSQRLDLVTSRLGRPSQCVQQQRLLLASKERSLQLGLLDRLHHHQVNWERLLGRLSPSVKRSFEGSAQRSNLLAQRLRSLDPQLVLQRGYAWLTIDETQTLSRVNQAVDGQQVQATLADGVVSLVVDKPTVN